MMIFKDSDEEEDIEVIGNDNSFFYIDTDGDNITYQLYYSTSPTFDSDNTILDVALLSSHTLMFAGLGSGFGLALLGLVGHGSQRRRLLHVTMILCIAFSVVACENNNKNKSTPAPQSPGLSNTVSTTVNNLNPSSRRRNA